MIWIVALADAFVITPSKMTRLFSPDRTLRSKRLFQLSTHSENKITVCDYHQVTIPTSLPGPPRQAISVEDLTPRINDLLKDSGMSHGVVNVISRHTTTAITINEREKRLADDMAAFFWNLPHPTSAVSRRGSKLVANTSTTILINVLIAMRKPKDVEKMAGKLTFPKSCKNGGIKSQLMPIPIC